MCGIMAYIGKDQAYPIVIQGLKKLEYRGYDSAGVAIMNGSLHLHKKKGKVAELEHFAQYKNCHGNVALGHTRWATHGLPNDNNAHPHVSQSQRLVMVHNGIIENYASLRSFLLEEGYTFYSETDTEIIVQYIEWYQQTFELSLKEAMRRALGDVKGSYGIVALDVLDPNKLILAKKDSPLVIGLADDAFYAASDAGPLAAYTDSVVYLKDECIAEINGEGTFEIIDLENNTVDIPVTTIANINNHTYEKDSYDSFMLKEIFQQSDTVKQCLAGRIKANKIMISEIENHRRLFKQVDKITIIGCGTSWHAGLIGEYLIEQLAGISVEVEYASEFRYRSPVIRENDMVIVISQSGETADTLSSLKLANEMGAFTYALVNTERSTIARHADIVSYINAGPEIGVASTKAFTAQVTLLSMIAIQLGQLKGHIKGYEASALVRDIEKLPDIIDAALKCNSLTKEIAKDLSDYQSALFMGRGINYPVALEGSLKLKEISYIHAEGYPAAEMKHGPIALIDHKMPSIILATNTSLLDKVVSNIREIKSRNGSVILIKNAEDPVDSSIYDYCIELPKVHELLSPVIGVIPLQLLSYHVAKMRGCDVDRPRNLAKSVTVE